jgi:hypothetical protein
MSTLGISLVGFIDDAQAAINHLLNACVSENADTGTLTAQWLAARALLGKPFPNAGLPDIQSIPPSHHSHRDKLLALPSFPNSWRPNCTVALVEIDPILAYQMTINSDTSNDQGDELSTPPTLDELMSICLPLEPAQEAFTIVPGQNSLVLKAKSLNIRQQQGFWNKEFMGMQFGVAHPFAHVVRHGGRCFLLNGYHRAFRARLAGATHMPCVLRDVGGQSEVGMDPPAYFSLSVLTSGNAPTLGHFTQGRGLNVNLRRHSRIINVNWAEHIVPDE